MPVQESEIQNGLIGKELEDKMFLKPSQESSVRGCQGFQGER